MEPSCEFTIDRAENLATEAWGLHVRAESLVGFADDNFQLRTDDGGRFVLKISPPGTDREWLQCQISVLLHLAASPLADLVPRVVPARNGQTLLLLDEESTPPRWARLMSYLEGTPLAKVAERPPSLLEEIGRTLARLDLALADFDHPGAHRDFDWDLPTAPKNAHLIADVDDPSRRALVENHFEEFDARVTPPSFRARTRGDPQRRQ